MQNAESRFKQSTGHVQASGKPRESRMMPFMSWNGVASVSGSDWRPNQGLAGKALISMAWPLPITTLPEMRELRSGRRAGWAPAPR